MTNLSFSMWTISAGFFIFLMSDEVGKFAGVALSTIGLMVFIYKVIFGVGKTKSI